MGERTALVTSARINVYDTLAGMTLAAGLILAAVAYPGEGGHFAFRTAVVGGALVLSSLLFIRATRLASGTQRHLRRVLLHSVLAAVTLVAAAAIQADAAVSGEVITAWDTTRGRPVEFSAADGSQYAFLSCGGDLTHAGPPRSFLVRQQAPSGSGHYELFAYDEACATGEQLTNTPDRAIGYARWSLDGAHVAFTATDPAGVHAIYEGDVTFDWAGAPVGLVNVHAAVTLPFQPLELSWADDGRRVAFTMSLPLPAPSTGTQSDVFVADLLAGTFTNVTNTSSLGEFTPDFSPLANRIAYVRRTSRGGPYRNDIFVLDISLGRTTQVTNKTNANLAQIAYPSWSPDGQNLAFSAYAISIADKSDVYRIRADGTQKAALLTGSSPDGYSAPIWRA